MMLSMRTSHGMRIGGGREFSLAGRGVITGPGVISAAVLVCLDPAQTVPSHLDVSAQNNPFRRL